MDNKSLHPYLQERLDNEIQFFSANQNQRKKNILDCISKGRLLKETIIDQVYPEWKMLIGDKDPTYFRIDVSSRKADAYSDLNKRPLLVVPPPNRLKDEDTFSGYYGMNSSLFVKKVRDGLIVPQILWPTEYLQLSDFGKSLFNQWLEDEGLHEKMPLVFANRIQRLFGGELSATGWVAKYHKKLDVIPEEEQIAVPGLGMRMPVNI